jgi:hypothetical protein
MMSTFDQLKVCDPTQHLPAAEATRNTVQSNLAWAALCQALLPEGRSLLDWERRDAGEFFWSQFK